MNLFVSEIYAAANAEFGTAFEPGQNASVDGLATKIAIQTGISNSIAPAEILSLLNEGLGTSFTITDYNRAAQEFGLPTADEASAEVPAAAVSAEPAAAVESLLALEPEVVESEVVQPEVAEAEVVQAEVVQPEVVQPEVVQPVSSLLEVADIKEVDREEVKEAQPVSRVEEVAAVDPVVAQSLLAVDENKPTTLLKAEQPASLLDVPGQKTATEVPITSLLAVDEKAPAAQTPRLKAVVFGDSMSEYVGYNPDGTPNTKYGTSVADVIGANLGIEVKNLATGGETSMEALAGGNKFGAFADYIATNKPEYAIIRYGAADAIKSKDPQATLDAVQQMVNIAKANGVTPIIVGVSELYGAQNSKTGNIAGYIDPGAEQRANAINEGLAKIAANNGVSFTDVRSTVSAGKGDLLDGVHSNADFGKKMADAISESIVNVIPEANVPKLPSNVDALSTTEKGQLYNSLVSQGYTDAQIKTAAKAESDQDWNALKRVAADVKNTTPAQIDRQAQSAAVLETGLLAQSADTAQTAAVTSVEPAATTTAAKPTTTAVQPDTTGKPAAATSLLAVEDKTVADQPKQQVQTAGLLATDTAASKGGDVKKAQVLPSTIMQKASELLVGSGKANDARYADQPVGSFGEGGKVYSVYGDGSITAIREGADGDYFYEGFTPEGQLAAQEYSDKFKQTAFDKAIGVAGNALIAAASAAALGPLGVGFTAPTAAAIGSGATTLISTGDLTQAAKAALLGGVGAYGGQQVTGLLNNAAYDLSFAAADAAQLANQGLSAGAIAQNLATYVDPATAISLANTASTQAFALADANQLVQQGLNTNQVAQVLQQSGINADAAVNIANAAADGITALSASDVIPEVQFQKQTRNINQQGLLSPADAERVMVTGQGFDIPGIQQLAQGLGTGLSTAVLPTAPVGQSISVTGQNIPTTQPVSTTIAPAAAASLLTPGQSISVTGQNMQQQQAAGPAGAMLGTAIAPAQMVEVEGRTIPTATPPATITGGDIAAGTASNVKDLLSVIDSAKLPVPGEPTSLFSKTDAALAGLLLGGAGSLLNQSQTGGFTMDPNLANSIINAPRPTYGRGIGGYQMPGMFQIAPTNVYNPFATTAPFGTGRFGGFAAPITLPSGLL